MATCLIKQENRQIKGANIGRLMTQKLIFIFILMYSNINLHMKENIVTYDSYFARIPTFAKSVYVWDMSTYGTMHCYPPLREFWWMLCNACHFVLSLWQSICTAHNFFLNPRGILRVMCLRMGHLFPDIKLEIQ